MYVQDLRFKYTLNKFTCEVLENKKTLAELKDLVAAMWLVRKATKKTVDCYDELSSLNEHFFSRQENRVEYMSNALIIDFEKKTLSYEGKTVKYNTEKHKDYIMRYKEFPVERDFDAWS